MKRAWQTELRRLVTHQGPPATKAGGKEPGNNNAADGISWRDHVSGKAELNGRTITVKELGLGSPTRDLHALAAWLSARGCTGFRYGVQTE